MGSQQGFPLTPPREPSIFEKLLQRLQQRGLWQSFLEFEEPLSSGLVRGATLGLLGGEPLRLLPRPEEPGPFAEELGGIGEAAGAFAPMLLSGGLAETALPARLAGAGRTAAVGAASFGLPELGREALEGELHPERLAREATLGAAFGLPSRALSMLGVGGAELAFGGTPAQAILGAALAGIAGGHKRAGIAETPPVAPAVEPAGLLPARFPITREERLRNAAARGRPQAPRWPEAAAPPPADKVSEILPKAIDWRESSFRPVEARLAGITKPVSQLEIMIERGASPAGIQAVERLAQAPTAALEEALAQGDPATQRVVQAALAIKKGAYVPEGAPAINRLPEATQGVKTVPVPDLTTRSELETAMDKLRAAGPEGETRATALKDLHDEAAATQQRYARTGQPVPPEIQRSFETRQEELIRQPTRFSTPQQAFAAAQRQVRTYKTPAEVDAFLDKMPDHFGLEASAVKRLKDDARGYKRVLTEAVTLRDIVKQRQATAGSSGDAAFDARLGEHGLTALNRGKGRFELVAGGQTVRRFADAAEAKRWLDDLTSGAPRFIPQLSKEYIYHGTPQQITGGKFQPGTFFGQPERAVRHSFDPNTDEPGFIYAVERAKLRGKATIHPEYQKAIARGTAPETFSELMTTQEVLPDKVFRVVRTPKGIQYQDLSAPGYVTSIPELQALAHQKGLVADMISEDAIRLTNQLTGKSQTFRSLADAAEAAAGHPPLQAPDIVPLAAEDPHFSQPSNLGSQSASESRLPLCSGPWESQGGAPERFAPIRPQQTTVEHALSSRAVQYDLERSAGQVPKAFDETSPIRLTAEKLPEQVRAAGVPGTVIAERGKRYGAQYYGKTTPQGWASTVRAPAGPGQRPIARQTAADHEFLGHAVYESLPQDLKDEWRRLMTDYGVIHPSLKRGISKGGLYERTPPDRLSDENFAYYMADYLQGRLTRASRVQKFGPRVPSALVLDFFRSHGGKL